MKTSRKYIHQHDIFTEYCRLNNKYGLYVSLTEKGDKVAPDWEEMKKACSFLRLSSGSLVEDMNIFIDGYGYFTFDTKDDLEYAYLSCVGEDGPTPINPEGSSVYSCYALTFGPHENGYGMLNENT